MHINWWTLALQTVNVLILIWLLARFLFRPIADIVAARQQEAGKLLSDAAAAQAAAQAARSDAALLRAQIEADRGRLIAEAQKAERIERDNLLAQASQEIAKRRSDAAASIARDQAAAEQMLLARASDLAIDIARRLVARPPQPLAFGMFIEGLCAELRGLPLQTRQAIAAAAKNQPIEVASSAQLSSEDTERVRAELTAILGPDVPILFRNDAGLLAGLELHSRNIIVSNSWRADLERIREELTRDQHQHQA